MSRTEDRLTDALTAAARTVPEERLRPLIAPPRQRRAAWVTPLAAALGIVLVVGLAIAVGTRLAGSGSSSGPAGGPVPVPRYYVVEALQGGTPVVRSTLTGKITATVPVSRAANAGVDDMVASSRGGVYFVAAAAPGTQAQRLYRFRLTSGGRVTGFTVVPGGTVGARFWVADAMAASPDGSRVAVSLSFNWMRPCGGAGSCRIHAHPDHIDVIDVRSGARSVWRGGTGQGFSVASLSWTAYGRQLVYLGQTCGRSMGDSETCSVGGRTAEVRALNPATHGGRLDSGRVFFRQSARYPYIAQAQVSPDGSTITAIVLSGRVKGTRAVSGFVPSNLTVIQVSPTTGQLLRLLYQRNLGATTEITNGPDFLQLSQDGPGQHWMFSDGACATHCTGTYNGWLRDGQLVPLPPVNGEEVAEAW